MTEGLFKAEEIGKALAKVAKSGIEIGLGSGPEDDVPIPSRGFIPLPMPMDDDVEPLVCEPGGSEPGTVSLWTDRYIQRKCLICDKSMVLRWPTGKERWPFYKSTGNFVSFAYRLEDYPEPHGETWICNFCSNELLYRLRDKLIEVLCWIRHGHGDWWLKGRWWRDGEKTWLDRFLDLNERYGEVDGPETEE